MLSSNQRTAGNAGPPGAGRPDAFHAAVEMSLVPIVLADPHQDDYPIVFANGAFCELTGYDVKEILGRNCRLLQGPDTDRQAVARIRAGLSARWHVYEELLNYRKDGSRFWNALFINPVFDSAGTLVYFFGTQLNVTRRRALEDFLHQSGDLLDVMASSVAAALARPLSEEQRVHLQKAELAMRETARRRAVLLSGSNSSSWA